MKYKYHYLIKNKCGEVVDTAQDKFIKDIMMNWLCQYHGLTYIQSLSIERKRISKDEWKARYC